MVIFNYKSGANPYIVKTEKEKDRLLKKYKGKITKQKGIFTDIYTIDDLQHFNEVTVWKK